MNIIDFYFKKFMDGIFFIDFKGMNVKILEDIGVAEDINLPIITDKLLNEFSSSQETNEISTEQIFEGIVYTLGADENFQHNEDYLKILYAINSKPEDLIFKKAIEAYNNGELVLSGLFIRAYNILKRSAEGLFYYGLILESIAEKLIDLEQEDNTEQFLNEAVRLYEMATEADSDYFWAFYKLGFHYKVKRQFTKAKLTWEKALLLDSEHIKKDEIMSEIAAVETESIMEQALNYLDTMNYDKALDYLVKLFPEEENNWYVNYIAGIAYSGYGDLEKSIEFMERALTINPDEADIYNELGITYFNEGKITESIEVFSKGIDNCESDFRLYFNRGLAELNLGNVFPGYEDIKKANSLSPENKEISMQLEALENYINKAKGD
ncbi:MAG: hypothetical protein RBT15_08095 [Gudongella sp.]|jgi:tetratricopeptide (TPR) repeat protein|nr:hypothetical protein [Gudongella sp.]